MSLSAYGFFKRLNCWFLYSLMHWCIECWSLFLYFVWCSLTSFGLVQTLLWSMILDIWCILNLSEFRSSVVRQNPFLSTDSLRSEIKKLELLGHNFKWKFGTETTLKNSPVALATSCSIMKFLKCCRGFCLFEWNYRQLHISVSFDSKPSSVCCKVKFWIGKSIEVNLRKSLGMT